MKTGQSGWMWRGVVAAAVMSVGFTGMLALGQAGPTAPAAPASAPADQVFAKINNLQVMRNDFYSALIQVSGQRVFGEMVELVVVREAYAKSGMPALTDKDFAAEKQRALDAVKRQAKAAAKPVPNMNDTEAEQALAVMMNQRGITAIEIRWMFEKATYLRALAKASKAITVTPEILKENYLLRHGECRDVRVYAMTDMEQVTSIRNAMTKDKSFAQVAEERGIQAGRMRVAKDMEYKEKGQENFKEIQRAVFSPTMQEGSESATLYLKVYDAPAKAGDPPKERQQMAIVVLDRKVAATGKKFEEVKADLAVEVQEDMETQWGNSHLRNVLLPSATVDIQDPIWKDIAASMQYRPATSTAPATGPATAPVAPK